MAGYNGNNGASVRWSMGSSRLQREQRRRYRPLALSPLHRAPVRCRYAAPEACALPVLSGAWEELTNAEQTYLDGIKVKLTSVKRIGAMV